MCCIHETRTRGISPPHCYEREGGQGLSIALNLVGPLYICAGRNISTLTALALCVCLSAGIIAEISRNAPMRYAHMKLRRVVFHVFSAFFNNLTKFHSFSFIHSSKYKSIFIKNTWNWITAMFNMAAYIYLRPWPWLLRNG